MPSSIRIPSVLGVLGECADAEGSLPELRWKKRRHEAAALMAALLEKQPEKSASFLQTAAAIESSRKITQAAIPYYDRAIKLLGKPEKKDWQLYYSRGVAFERTKQWPKAEPDFKTSIELDPEQGASLNYLGYSWLDQNMHVPEAFDLIKKAVRLRPNDGYIIDSLGWAYYLQKDYEQAVKHLDKAVDLRPEDQTLNDHLGDVYWRLRRKLEAKFQWTQALSLESQSPTTLVRSRRSLRRGWPTMPGLARKWRSSRRLRKTLPLGNRKTQLPMSRKPPQRQQRLTRRTGRSSI